MTTPITIKVEGLDQLMARLRAEPLLAAPLRKGFDKVGFLVTSEARKRAPVDRGTLRASIAHQVDPSPLPLWVTVGAKPHYAPYMEYGTGLVHDHPSWPRKGLDGDAARVRIMRRGGLTPRRYLRGALEDNRERIVRIVSGAIRTVANNAGG